MIFWPREAAPARLIKEYGMSEVAGIVCVSYGDWEAGDVGRPLPGCRIIAVDPETGAGLPTGGAGGADHSKQYSDEWILRRAGGGR